MLVSACQNLGAVEVAAIRNGIEMVSTKNVVVSQFEI